VKSKQICTMCAEAWFITIYRKIYGCIKKGLNDTFLTETFLFVGTAGFTYSESRQTMDE